MRLRNEFFLHVLDWLHHNKGVRDQAHLASIIGINAASMSRIMTGRNEPSEDTLRKLNEAFGNIFNMKYLRGKDPYHMLISDLVEDMQEKKEIDLGTSSITAAPFIANRATAYSGNLFSNMNAFTISLNDTWLSDAVLTW